ncbi:MAG: S9 family peptidase [Bacteroidota bacterium]
MRILCVLLFLSQFTFGQITVESIWKTGEFRTAGVSGFRSMNDGIHFTKISEKDGKVTITMHKITDSNGEGKVLVSADELTLNGQPIDIQEYEFNSDESKILIMTKMESIYRRSYVAVHYLLDLKTKKIEPLDSDRSPQTLAEYSPDGTKVSFIYKNDLFVKDLQSGKVRKLTYDGKTNKVINGTTDWVYEEEFGITKAYDWSPDSKKIAFLKFNEKKVKEFSLTYYNNELYPEQYTFKYPKAGEDNSKVSAHVLDIKSGKLSTIALGEYEYIPRLTWSNTSNKLILQTLNRHQNLLRYHLYDATSKKPTVNVFYEERSSAYVEIDNNLTVLKDDNSLLRTSEADGFNHIYRLGFDGTMTQITKGSWDVIELYGIDNENEYIYYSSAENSAITKILSRIRINGNDKALLSETSGYNDAEFTSGMRYFVKTHSDANTPPVYSLCDNTGKEIAVLEDNKKLREKLNKYELGKKEFMTFDLGTHQLNGWMIKPKNFDPTKKYPVYMTVYGGPGHNEVTDSWDGSDYMYHQLLTQRGYIIVSVDPRGTMYRGAEFKKSTYLQLGKLETEDIINTAKELQEMPFIAADRIGIQGWSYGGFMSSLAITKGADQFKMAIAVAPVTNWKFYDNIYTERFMRTPAENESGYNDNSPINFVNKLKGKYLLIHGSGDDNVHYQNTMEMINALVKADKQFDLFIYPNRNHGIYGGNTRNHLFTMMLNYTVENL